MCNCVPELWGREAERRPIDSQALIRQGKLRRVNVARRHPSVFELADAAGVDVAGGSEAS